MFIVSNLKLYILIKRGYLIFWVPAPVLFHSVIFRVSSFIYIVLYPQNNPESSQDWQESFMTSSKGNLQFLDRWNMWEGMGFAKELKFVCVFHNLMFATVFKKTTF